MGRVFALTTRIPKVDGCKLLLILVTAFVARLVYISLFVDFEWDGYDRFIKGIHLASDPWNMWHHWVWLPLPQYIYAVLYVLTHTYMAVRLFSVICGCTSVATLYKLTLKVSGSTKAAELASLLMAFNPLILMYDTTGMTEPLFTLLLLSATYMFVSDRLLTCSALLAVSCLVRYEGWLVTPFFYVVEMLRKKSILKPVLSLLMPFSAMFSWIYANYVFHGDPLFFLHGLNTFLAQWLPYFRRACVAVGLPGSLYLGMFPGLTWSWYSIILFVYLTPPAFVASLKALIGMGKRGNVAILAALSVYYLSILTALTVLGKCVGWPRHAIPCMPFFTTLAAHYVARRGRLKPFIAKTLAASMVILILCTTWVAGMSSSIKQTARWLRENAEDGIILCRCPAIIVESHLPMNRFTQAWGVDDEELYDFVVSHNISYIVSDFGRFENACRNYTVVYASQNFIIYKVDFYPKTSVDCERK